MEEILDSVLASDIFRIEAEYMFNDLDSNRLEVSLSGSIDSTGRKKRVVESSNPEWYRKLFSDHSNTLRGHRARSSFRRCRVLPALKNLSLGKCRPYETYYILYSEILGRITDGYEVDGHFVKPPLEVDSQTPGNRSRVGLQVVPEPIGDIGSRRSSFGAGRDPRKLPQRSIC